MNRCLDNAIASAVTSWTGDHETGATAAKGERVSKDVRLRRLVSGSIKLSELLRAGKVAPGGSTAIALGQSLEKMRVMLDPSTS